MLIGDIVLFCSSRSILAQLFWQQGESSNVEDSHESCPSVDEVAGVRWSVPLPSIEAKVDLIGSETWETAPH